MQVKIKICDKTNNHLNVLKAKGYEVVEEDGHLVVECAEHLDDVTVDLNTDEGKTFVNEAIAAHKMFGYRTKFILPGESEPLSGIFVVGKISSLSAFVAKKADEPKEDTVTEELRSVLSDLGL